MQPAWQRAVPVPLSLRERARVRGNQDGRTGLNVTQPAWPPGLTSWWAGGRHSGLVPPYVRSSRRVHKVRDSAAAKASEPTPTWAVRVSPCHRPPATTVYWTVQT